MWGAAALSFVAIGGLLWAYFARYFSPLLNVARGLPVFRASSDSASWPDAAIWRKLRAAGYAVDGLSQARASLDLLTLLTRTWLAGRLFYAAALAAYVVVVAANICVKYL